MQSKMQRLMARADTCEGLFHAQSKLSTEMILET